MSSVACRFWSTDWSERIFRTAPVLHILQGTSNVRRPIQYSYEYEYGLPPALQYRTLREYGDALSLAVESSIVSHDPPGTPGFDFEWGKWLGPIQMTGDSAPFK